MDLKYILVFVVLFHLTLLENIHASPLFSYIFGDDEESTDGNSVDNGAAATKREEYANEKLLDTPESETSATKVNEANNKYAEDARQKLIDAENARSQCAGVGGFVARMLDRGVQGLKTVVQGSSNLTKQAISGVGQVSKTSIDLTQDFLDRRAMNTLNTVSDWSEKADMYRKALSAGSRPNADKSHSITVTTSSDAPVKSLTDFFNKYTPGGGETIGSAPLPEITSIDFSQFWRK